LLSWFSHFDPISPFFWPRVSNGRMKNGEMPDNLFDSDFEKNARHKPLIIKGLGDAI
jgi:hypothetical protein